MVSSLKRTPTGDGCQFKIKQSFSLIRTGIHLVEAQGFWMESMLKGKINVKRNYFDIYMSAVISKPGSLGNDQHKIANAQCCFVYESYNIHFLVYAQCSLQVYTNECSTNWLPSFLDDVDIRMTVKLYRNSHPNYGIYK